MTDLWKKFIFSLLGQRILMDDTNFTGRWVKKFRILTMALIFSGALNIGLLAAFIFQVLQEKQPSLPFAMPSSAKEKQEMGNGQILKAMSKLSFRELISFLTNKDFVEEGYTKRDLAISALVSFYHFNLEKALSANPAQKRVLEFPEGTYEVYPGLTDDQFGALIRYAYEEKWPLTSKGLFAALQKLGIPHDESLCQAFIVTPEFYALQALFQKTEAPQDPAVLLKLATEGNWDILERFTREQDQMLDLSIDKRRRLLLSYLSLHSPTAAQLILKTDFAFALKRLEDRGILDLLGLLKEKSDESVRFCVELLRSPRSDAIWQASAAKLYAFSGEESSADPKTALARFAPTAPPIKMEPESAPPAPVAAAVPPPAPVKAAAAAAPVKAAPAEMKLHVVKEGESLWKIARQYKIKLDDLVKLNDLEKDRLFPGMTLRIPDQGTGSEPPR